MLADMGHNQTQTPTLPRQAVRRYAIGSIGTGGFGTLPGLVLVYFLTDSLGVTALAAGVIMTVAKLWDVVIDPLLGSLSDASLKRTGSRRRFMLLGALLLPVSFVLMFAVPPGLTGWGAAAWVLVFFTACATAFSLFQVPYIALPAELSDDYDDRTRILTWRVVVLTIGILAFGGGGPALRELAGDNVRLGYIIMALVAAFAFGWAFWLSSRVAPVSAPAPESERVRIPVSQWPAILGNSYQEALGLLRANVAFRALLGAFFAQALATGLMLASAQYVATGVMDSQAAVTYLFVALIGPALFMAPVWGRLALRVGKERAFVYASLVFLAGALALGGLLWWEPGIWVYIAVAVCGGAYAGMQSLPMAMLPDVISYSLDNARQERKGSESSQGPKNSETGAGTFGGTWTAGETTGMALGTTLMTVLLAVSGYIESTAGQTVTQPDSAVTAIVVAFSIAPAVCVALSLVPLLRYPLRRHDISGPHAPETSSQSIHG
jgi:Na+/melibiose symporter-like transporter